jgi:hypothetical protein
MAGNITEKLGTAALALTCSLAPGGTGLANNGARESTAIDNSSDLFQDVLVQLKIKSGASGVSSSGVVNVYAYGTVDPATPTYADNCTGTDASVTLVVPPNLRVIGQLNVVANATTYKSMPMSVAAAFGGVMPTKWGIVIENKSGAALDTTEANHAKLYQGIFSQYT